jgi:rhodanese-related sulfurtransferase
VSRPPLNPSDLPTTTVDDLDPTAKLLDVREDDEWAAGHIDGALHIPMSRFVATLAESPQALPTDAPIVVVCAVGARSAQVTAWLNQHGYQARNLTGGMHAWDAARRPMSSDTGARPTVL